MKVEKRQFDYRERQEKDKVAQKQKEVDEKNRKIKELESKINAIEIKYDKERSVTTKLRVENEKLKQQKNNGDSSNGGGGSKRKVDTFDEKIALEKQKTENRLLEHQAKIAMNQVSNSQKQASTSAQRQEFMNQMTPFAALLSSGGGHKNGAWDASGVISNICGGSISQPPYSMQQFQPQQPPNLQQLQKLQQ